mmetsp:Transcript_123712/g.309212  ORF Transcript_123712/g.309212 Transcript_123712/m.309212 type:complete len:202 (-) Transcript_123712:555-1160(-)
MGVASTTRHATPPSTWRLFSPPQCAVTCQLVVVGLALRPETMREAAIAAAVGGLERPLRPSAATVVAGDARGGTTEEAAKGGGEGGIAAGREGGTAAEAPREESEIVATGIGGTWSRVHGRATRTKRGKRWRALQRFLACPREVMPSRVLMQQSRRPRASWRRPERKPLQMLRRRCGKQRSLRRKRPHRPLKRRAARLRMI